ncbi:MAG: hypothetical protein AB3N16_07885 [Flavobacteriaceae bacterium]
MNHDNKFNEKPQSREMTQAEKNVILKKLLEDPVWYSRLKTHPFSSAISLYAAYLHGPLESNFRDNAARVDQTLTKIESQLGAIIDMPTLNETERDDLISVLSHQKERLQHLRRLFSKDKTPNTIFGSVDNEREVRGRSIKLGEALAVTEKLADYYDALKNGTPLPQRPDRRLPYLLRCNAITHLHYETGNRSLKGIKVKNWALTEVQVVYAWLHAHHNNTERPILTLNGVSLNFNILQR